MSKTAGMLSSNSKTRAINKQVLLNDADTIGKAPHLEGKECMEKDVYGG
jgi:hypothetical protein